MPEIRPLSEAEAAGRIAHAAGSGKALILTHVNPDADCIGSALGLRAVIRSLGGDADLLVPSPLPRYLAFLPALAGCDVSSPEPEELPADRYASVLSVDAASPVQLGKYAALIPEISLMIDHHGRGEPFAPYLVDPEAAAAGQIVYRLVRLLRERGILDSPLPDAARFLYCAVVGDTGGFQFSNTTPAVHRAAAELLEEMSADGNDPAGNQPDAAELCRRLLAEKSMTDLKAESLTIRNLCLYEQGRLAAVLFTRDMLREEGLTEEDIGGAVDIPRSLEGVAVALTLRQTGDDPKKFKLSSRANADLDCASVCAGFGGGGHKRAAGATIEADTPEEALSLAVNAFMTLFEQSAEAECPYEQPT